MDSCITQNEEGPPQAGEMTLLVHTEGDGSTQPAMRLLDEGAGMSAGPVAMRSRARPNLAVDGNKNGVPEIAQHRARLGKAFISRMRADFQKHGIGVIERVRKERPAAYLELIARLMPQQMEINVQHSFVDVLLEAQRRYQEEKPYVVIDAEVMREYDERN